MIHCPWHRSLIGVVARSSLSSPPMHQIILSLLILASAFAFQGCMTIKVALGLRVRLDDKPVTSITASLADPQGIGPGQSSRLIIVADTSEGKQLVTVGPGHGKVLFSSFTYTSEFAVVGKRGFVSLPDDPRVTEGKTPRLHIMTNGHPAAIADVAVPVRYDVPFWANFSGADGYDGGNGSDGAAGSDGANGSTDPNHPAAGSDGSDGGSGGDGQDGGDGGNGQPVNVWLTLRPGTKPMLQARAVTGDAAEMLYLIDPLGGSLTIATNGGKGGAGGRGGNGGTAGKGGNGIPAGRDGAAGQSGRSGRDGRGGAAGEIHLVVDPSAQSYLDRIHFSNLSGDGEPGPAPIVTIQAVPLIW
jgi:hypothetical protein